MKQCRIVLRRAAAADDAKVFCNLLGRKLINSSDNDDEGLLGSPAMVSRPLDFRTIDLRLAAGAYGGSHEAFLEDVHEVCVLSKICCLTMLSSNSSTSPYSLPLCLVLYNFLSKNCPNINYIKKSSATPKFHQKT